MTNEEFNTLTSRLEEQARRNPAGYRFRVILLGLLGNAYLAIILLVITALFMLSLASVVTLNAVGLKLVLVVGFFLWTILKALWVKIPPPEGMTVSERKSPELFALIKALRRELNAPEFDHVIITDEFNAAVMQTPRLGIFGWHENYLLIGLPLMKSLTVEQFKAVLAHEFGHLSKGHGRMSNWIYRQRLRWVRLVHALDAQNSAGSFLVKPFLNWFAPYFSAYSFPLARANEYEADATSARLTSPRAAAEALTSVNIVGNYLGERYWPDIHKQADELPRPGFTPYSSMSHGVATDLDEASIKIWLARALKRETTSDDTHPALADRLKAIGETARVAPPAAGQAADRLLGESLDTITEIFDRRWQEKILPSWQERYQSIQQDRRRLAELDARHAAGAAFTVKEACDRAWLTESVGKNAEASFEQFRMLLEREPDNPMVCYGMGMRLLARDDDAGCALMERAMQMDEDATITCCEALRNYAHRRGRDEEAQTWHQRLVERYALQAAAAQERNRISIKDKFDRHDLPDEALAAVRAQLRSIKGLRSAYFVKKRVRHLPHRPCYVLGFTVAGMFALHSKRRAAEVSAQIQKGVAFPGETFIINVEGNNYRFGRKFYWMKGARIL